MIRLLTILLCLAVLPTASVSAEEESRLNSYEDYILIKHIPSRLAFQKREPIRELKAVSHTSQVKADGSVMSTNEDIKSFYDEIKSMKAQGGDGRRYPDGRFWTIHVSYMGDVVQLDNGVKKDADDINAKEKEWWALHKRVFEFITKGVAP